MEIDDDNVELKKLNEEVLADSDSFEPWQKLIQAAETLEGGVNRNSSPQSIAIARNAYDRFLAKFPLFHGYWNKYADLEFAIAGTEAAELVYERAVASVTVSVDLWTQYTNFKMETCHDPDTIRELFERGANHCGIDFLSHPFWDKYIEFETRFERPDRIFSILNYLCTQPFHQYARWFEQHRTMAASRPLQELASPEILAQYRAEIEAETGPNSRSETEIEQQLRARMDAKYVETFHKTQEEVNKRWTYEQNIKRLYFHIPELPEAELENWKKYLDFEEEQGDYQRIVFLYERTLMPTALYEEFWLRYARWMLGQAQKPEAVRREEVRYIYARASCFYVPIARPTCRLQWALFEEMEGRIDVAQAIYEAILVNLPGHVEAIIAAANMQRRQFGVDAAVAFYKAQIDSSACDSAAKAALVAQSARLLWKVKDAAEEARNMFETNKQTYQDSPEFWTSFLNFELDQAPGHASVEDQHSRIRAVFEEIRQVQRLPEQSKKDLAHAYMAYLLERGSKDAAKEYTMLDREINQ